MEQQITTKQREARASRMERQSKAMREVFWPGLPDDLLWDRKQAAGFTPIPRTMSYLMNIIDSLSKGQPAGQTYLAIWCRMFNVGIVELPSENQCAFEAGFTGERAGDTWRKRMRHLKDLGFIDYREGTDHAYQWVLVYNPHHAVLRLGARVQERLRAGWRVRAVSVGSLDVDGEPPPLVRGAAAAPPSALRPRKSPSTAGSTSTSPQAATRISNRRASAKRAPS